MKRVGYWISEKKSKKLNFEEHRPIFRNAGIELVKLDLTQPLDNQGPFDAIVHKVTDILAKADNGNATSQQYIRNIQGYADSHPECMLLDPLDSTRRLLDRYKQYQQVCTCDLVCTDPRVIIPTFVELTTTDVEQNKMKLAEAGVTFPIVVKPILSHGSRLAHEMAIIFSKDHLQDVEVPCVAQSFLNHNAILYKVFVVGSRQFVVQRPSLKNLYPGNHATIFFDTQEVSKPGSAHPLNEIDAASIQEPLVKPDWQLLEQLGASISRAMDMCLIGIDVIIDCQTQQYAIIDINSFPGFEGVDDFFVHLRDHILQQMRTKDNCDTTSPAPQPAPTFNTNTTTVTKTAAAKTAATNAANLKVSQKFILEQSRLIDCSTDNTAGSVSLKSGKRSGSKNSCGSKEEEAAAKEPILAQLRSNNNLSPDLHPH
ncbi:inositol-tetrakisphosphate 1-kinase-like isoform X2 [Littorina saxatilis]|uniref:Inositol-tetrakisphosphate 1-kinase n=1 Tax=Littorina saxatilis TaxID=31220 RepID=A0AAN9BE99_9CAEN